MLTLRGNIFSFQASQSLSQILKNRWCDLKNTIGKYGWSKALFCLLMNNDSEGNYHSWSFCLSLAFKAKSAFCSAHWDFVFFALVWEALYAGCAAEQNPTSTPMQNWCELLSACSQSWWALDTQVKTACTDIVFLSPLMFWAKSGLLLVAFSHQRHKRCCLFTHCQKQMFLLVHSSPMEK